VRSSRVLRSKSLSPSISILYLGFIRSCSNIFSCCKTQHAIKATLSMSTSIWPPSSLESEKCILKVSNNFEKYILVGNDIYFNYPEYQSKICCSRLYKKKINYRSRFMNSTPSNLVKFCLFCIAYNIMHLRLRFCILVIYIITNIKISSS
jgi:hypothetical protein